jgi:LPPG:FO 2-phospho-L-lactate transferase
MRVCAITGAGGSARFCAGLVRVVDPANVTIVVNTGDDERMRGLHVSPDIDTMVYHLCDGADWDRFWGLADETFVVHSRYRTLVERLGETGDDLQEWFALGDRDIATNMLRTRLLALGRTLSEATDAVARALGVAATVLPMSDDPAPTTLETARGERLEFQTYFVRRQQDEDIARVDYAGGSARPAPGVLDAIAAADVFVIPPSNPVLSIGPILALPGVRDAIAGRPAPRVAISPLIGGRAVKGPTDRVLASLGYEVSSAGVAAIYAGLVDVFVLDATEAENAARIEALGMRVVVTDTMMPGPEAAARVAKDVLDAL